MSVSVSSAVHETLFHRPLCIEAGALIPVANALHRQIWNNSRTLQMWGKGQRVRCWKCGPMFALFKYERLSHRRKGLALRPLLQKLYISLCVGRLQHMALVRGSLLRLFLDECNLQVHTKYPMSGTIRFVLLMQHRGIMESKRIKRFEFHLGLDWFSEVILHILQAWLPGERCGPRSNFWPHSVLRCALFTGETNFSVPVLFKLWTFGGSWICPAYQQRFGSHLRHFWVAQMLDNLGSFFSHKGKIRAARQIRWDTHAAKRFVSVFAAFSRNCKICVQIPQLFRTPSGLH